MMKLDPEDGHLLHDCSWYIDNKGYVRNSTKGYLHRVVLRKHGLLDEDLYVDHINRDKLDNRKENLRCVTSSINLHNSKHDWARNTPEPKHIHKRYGKFYAMLTVKGKTRVSRCVSTIEEALVDLQKLKEEMLHDQYLVPQGKMPNNI